MKVLALTESGNMTFCYAKPENRGRFNCHHIAHQEEGMTPREFVEANQERIQDLSLRENFEGFIKDDGEVEILVYHISDEDLEGLYKIEGMKQLKGEGVNETTGAYIELEHALWSDADRNQFAQIYPMTPSEMGRVLHKESAIVLDVDPDGPLAGKYKVGQTIPLYQEEVLKGRGRPRQKTDEELAEEAAKRDSMMSEGDLEKLEDQGVTIRTGVMAMTDFAFDHGYEADSKVYVLPYSMRMGTGSGDDKIDSPLTSAYAYLFTTASRSNFSDEDRQNAYENLLNHNTAHDLRYRNSHSLADEFAGKSGIFRSAISGSSIGYSARAVISPSTDMKYGELKIPPSVAADIFRPTVMSQLASEGKTNEQIDEYFEQFNKPQARVSQAARNDLEGRIGGLRVAMNRQPSLHTASFQSYIPRVSDGPTTQLHPVYYQNYAADNDGDNVTLYGINNPHIVEAADRSIGAKQKINTQVPRNMAESAIMPQKDAMWGLMNVLSRRS